MTGPERLKQAMLAALSKGEITALDKAALAKIIREEQLTAEASRQVIEQAKAEHKAAASRAGRAPSASRPVPQSRVNQRPRGPSRRK